MFAGSCISLADSTEGEHSESSGRLLHVEFGGNLGLSTQKGTIRLTGNEAMDRSTETYARADNPDVVADTLGDLN